MYLTVFVSGIYHLFGGLEGSFVILINDCVLTDTLTAKCPSECSQQMITLMRRQDTTARAIPSRRSQTTTKKQLNSITNTTHTTTPKKKKTNKQNRGVAVSMADGVDRISLNRNRMQMRSRSCLLCSGNVGGGGFGSRRAESIG